MPGMATAELVMKCNVSVREHSKLPVQHSCSPAFMEDLAIGKCIIPFKALNADAIRSLRLNDYSPYVLKNFWILKTLHAVF